MISKTITTCRLCGSPNLDTIIELGEQPPANSLREDVRDVIVSIPLTVCRCQKCTTIQLTETVDPKFMFSDYVWVTGTSKGAREYSVVFADRIISKFKKKPEHLFAVEIASNDGTFLRRFQELGHRVLGVDPAKNLAEVAQKSGIPTTAEFFSSDVAKKVVLENGLADLVFARNVVPHVPDPNDVVAGMATCLHDHGVGAIEFHWIGKILAELHYDSIYHEHYFYHSLHSINELLLRHGLVLFDVAESPTSGGSLVAYFSKTKRIVSGELQNQFAIEIERGISSLETWQDFARQALHHRSVLNSMIENELNLKRKIIGYGASARSSTMLNFCGINHRHLICIADQNSFKHTRYTPGTDILIVAPEDALQEKPDTVVILAWNFKDEIIDDLKVRGFHGTVIIPLPNTPYKMEI